MPNIDDIYKSKYTGEEIDELLDKVQLQDFTYDSLKEKPIINQDLLIGGFTPQENTYYRHTGTTANGFANGIIYLYSGGKYTSIKGGGSGGGYILPVATGTRLGGVKIGDGLEITEDGILSAKSTGGVGKQGTGTGAEIFNSYEGEEANTASGNYSHAEGGGTEASGSYSHAEGGGAKAIGDFSHAEGFGTQTVGERSHAEGDSTLASGFGSHAEGDITEANGSFAHAEGTSTKANGESAHAEGEITTASGKGSHSEGLRTTAGGNYSHAEGTETIASGDNQHVQGRYNIEDTNKKYVHIVGNGTGGNARSNAHTLDWNGNAWYAGKVSGGTPENPAPVENANDYVTKRYFDENKGTTNYDELTDKPIINQDLSISGFVPTANTYYRHTGTTTTNYTQGAIYYYNGSLHKVSGVGREGTGENAEIFNAYDGEYANTASGNYSHAEGAGAKAGGEASHAEGGATTASGNESHSEGSRTTASGDYSHAEGSGTTASGLDSHAEGQDTQADGWHSHAEGIETKALGNTSHAEGAFSEVSINGDTAHAEGYGTKASSPKQHVQGKYNIEDTTGEYAHIVGNGTSKIARSNAHTLDWNGNAWYAGKVSGGTEANPAPVEKPNDYVTKKYFENMSKGGTPINEGDTLSKLYFDTEKTPDLSIFTYTLDENMGFYTAGLIGFKNASNEYIGYLSAVKVNDTVYALIYENRVTGDISYLYVSDNIEYGGTSFSKGWQSFNNPFPVTSGTVADLDQTATKPWNGVWVSEKAFYARTDEIPAEPNNGTLTIQKNGTTVGTFGANQSENTTANITVPTKVSELTNDAGYTANKGTVISILLNGTTYTADANGLVDLGTISGGTAYRSIYNSIY